MAQVASEGVARDQGVALSVLIVEDNTTTRLLLNDSLRSFGFNPTSASTAEEAMDLFEQGTFKIIVLDLVLPGMAGDAFCEWIRRHPAGADVYILVGTAGTSGKNLQSVLEAGANDYIEKPYIPKLLRVRLEVARREVIASVERRELQERLRNERDSVAAVLDGVATVIVALDRDHRIVRSNQSFRRLVGFEITDHGRRYLTDCLGLESDAARQMRERLESLTAGRTQEFGPVLETEVFAHDGQHRILNWSFTLMSGSPEAFLCAGTDVTERHAAERRLAYLATHDELTGLLNRANLEPLIRQAIDATRDGVRSYLLYLDLDNFKIVNDTAGHLAGDRLLVEVAEVLRGCVGKDDAVVRFGGDEFVAILRDMKEEHAREIAENLRVRLTDLRFECAGRRFTVRGSMGLVAMEADMTEERVMARADAACYASKRRGRNALSVFDSDDPTMAAYCDDSNWHGRVQDAIEDERFELWVQPVVCVRDEKPYYHEVLLRLQDPAGTSYLPAEFLPSAASLQLMGQIDRYVVEHTLRLLKQHPDADFAVNLSGQTLNDPDFAEWLATHVPSELAGRLILEITETELLTNLNSANRSLEAFKTHGFRVALDDFGSGFASFAYLRELAVDIIKIDASYVRAILERKTDRAFVEAISTIASNLELISIAEGVERPELLEAIRQTGIDGVQGNFVAKPHPASLL